MDPLKPSATLLIKLGSALVHAEELLASIEAKDVNAIAADRGAFTTVATDPEVMEWREAMDKMAFLPVKR